MNPYRNLYITQLNQLKEEISSYKNAGDIWKLTEGINNSAGNLCLHICGNLNHFIGAVAGDSGYVRDRDNEFSETNLSKDVLIKTVDETIMMIETVFDNGVFDDLKKIYPLDKFGKKVSCDFILARLVSHLSYHLGQINYHRRISGF